MNLQEKVRQLKLQGAMQVRHALWWERQIKTHGERKAEAFYRHLGLNHIERKGVEWEGLTLSREPKEHEKIAVKGVSQAQETSKEQIGKILLKLRDSLISDGLKGIRELSPAQYHTLILETPAEFRSSLRDRLIRVYREGRSLVVTELLSGKSLQWTDEPMPLNHTKQDEDEDEDEFNELDTLTDLTDSRVTNEVQSRITGAAARFALLGLTGAALIEAIQKELADGSVGYIDRAATGVGNKVIAIGRMDEMRKRSDEIERYEQSEILDQNTCGPCAEDDGKTASDPDDLPGAPNPSCEGGDYCRGFIVAIAPGG